MIPPRWQPLAHLIGARFREFVREPHAIFWVYGFPLILAVGLSIAFKSSKPTPPRVDVQESASEATHVEEVIRRLSDDSLGDEKPTVEALPAEKCKKRLREGKTALYLIVHDKEIEYKYDEARSDSVQARYWIEAVLSRKHTDLIARNSAVDEKGSRYVAFLFPGLIGINVMGGGLFGVGFVLVDMRVRKLFKRLMATPMRHSDLLLSLLIARMLFLFPEMTSLLCVGYFVFDVPMGDSFFSVLTVLFIVFVGATAFSGIGLLLGCRTEKTETISGLMNMIMLPMYIFSGIFFSSKRFPDEVQPLIQALPLTQLIDALREVMLEGASILDVAWRLGILAAYAVVTFTLALRWFKWR